MWIHGTIFGSSFPCLTSNKSLRWLTTINVIFSPNGWGGVSYFHRKLLALFLHVCLRLYCGLLVPPGREAHCTPIPTPEATKELGWAQPCLPPSAPAKCSQTCYRDLQWNLVAFSPFHSWEHWESPQIPKWSRNGSKGHWPLCHQKSKGPLLFYIPP